MPRTIRGTTVRTAALAFLVALAGCGGEAGEGGEGEMADDPLLNPRSPEMTRSAPDTFRATLETNEGDIVIEAYREWAPRGADRFYNLVAGGYYEGNRFFRVLDGFVAQWGLHPDSQVTAAWRKAPIRDEETIRHSNERGTVTFAQSSQPNTRTTQVFINYGDNTRLDEMGFAPFGRVVEGMEVAESLYSGYGDGPPRGEGPSQREIMIQGNEYLEEEFPELDYIEEARITYESGGEAAGGDGG